MKKILSLLAFTLLLGSCEKEETFKVVDNDFQRNFDVAWTLINDNYCYLGYKNINWDKVYDDFKPRVQNAKDEFEFFDILGDLIDILRDGHSAIHSNFDRRGSNYEIEPNGDPSPADYISDAVVAKYLVKKRVSKNKFIYGHIVQDTCTFAYICYPSFRSKLDGIDMEYVAKFVEGVDGIIVDIRDNPGGAGTYGINFAEHFFTEKTLVGYTAKKNGPGYDDFTEPYEIYVKPSATNNWANIPTMLLTNRGVYSTANLLTSILKYAPNVTQVGGHSGGGGGMPATYFLPNGWGLTFPSNVLYDVNKQHIENGIEPDVEVHITRQDEIDERDTILEKAIELLVQKQ